MIGRTYGCLLLLPTFLCQNCYVFSITHNGGKWEGPSKFMQEKCAGGCAYEEKHRNGLILFSLDCHKSGNTVEWSGCKRFEKNLEDLDCACLHDGCNIDFLLNRYPDVYGALASAASKPIAWQPEGTLKDCS